jgi:4-amino-4-deoxy-L-arabinose transferase-like glycosyltransferase
VENRSLREHLRTNRTRIILLVIFAAAMILRVSLAATCENQPTFSDMHDYNQLAVEGRFNTYLPPLYPLFLRLVYSVFGDYNYTAVFIVQSILMSFMILLMYDIVRRVADETAAVIAALLCAVNPNFIAYGLTTMTEALSLCIVVLIIWLLYTPFGELKKAIVLGCVLVAGIYIKSAMIFFVPPVLFASKRRLTIVLILAALISPWIIRNAVVHDKVAPVSDTGALNFYATYNPAATGSKHTDAAHTPLRTYDHDQMTYVREALKFIIHNKWKTVDITYNKVSLLLSRGWDTHVLKPVVGGNATLNNIMLYAYVPLAVLGFIGLIELYDRRNRIIALMMFSYLVLSILFAIFKYRYRVIIEPMLIMYASMWIGDTSE